MREILFRGKRTDNKEWVEGVFETQPITKLTFIRTPNHIYFDVNMVISETVGQYSGKDDVNGEKLFEGDIVKGLFLHSDSVLSVVTFKDGAFGLEWNRGAVKTFSAFASICNVRYEKIGNIHDNPELLKEGETE